MKMDSEKSSLLKETVSLAWPSVLEQVFTVLTTMVGTFMVSSLGHVSVAATGLTLQPKFFLMAPLFALNVATGAIIARKHGEENQDGAISASKLIILISTVYSILIGVLCFFLALSFLECIIFAFVFNSDEIFISSFAPFLWGVIYFAAGVFAYLSTGKKIFGEKKIKAPEKIQEKKINSVPVIEENENENKNLNLNLNAPKNYRSPCGKDYEAMTLRVIIKEGLKSLAESKFEDAEEYFTHALIRSPESSNAYIGKLMAKYRARNANELVCAPVLIESEEFFQKALMFASPRMRDVLEKYKNVFSNLENLSYIFLRVHNF